MMRCDHCKFYYHEKSECRRRTPIILIAQYYDVNFGHFPQVMPDEWCGEFQPYGIATIEEWIEQYNEQQLRACKAEAKVKTLLGICKDVDEYFSADYFPEGSETDKLIRRIQAAIADED